MLSGGRKYELDFIRVYIIGKKKGKGKKGWMVKVMVERIKTFTIQMFLSGLGLMCSRQECFMFAIAVLEKWRQEQFWGLLPGQSSLACEFQANKRPRFKGSRKHF